MQLGAQQFRKRLYYRIIRVFYHVLIINLTAMRKKLVLFMLGLFLGFWLALAQNRTITGTITLAEALCMQGGHDGEVQALLKTLNKNLYPAYNCTKTGAELLKEVKFYRRLDLWGEGQNWFDFKRWNEPIVRKSVADGGNWHKTFSGTIAPEANYKWTYFVPQKELDYNPLIRN